LFGFLFQLPFLTNNPFPLQEISQELHKFAEHRKIGL
jgi:hypothetical protein